MAGEPKPKVKCPYCDGEYSQSGIVSHVRHKHPEMYEEWREGRKATPTPAPKPVPEPDPEPDPKPVAESTEVVPEPVSEPAPKKQKGASFLDGVKNALRDW